MKFSNLAASALLAVSASARATFFDQSPTVGTADDTFDVPGDNPLNHCEDPKDDILKLTKVDISPNPPEAGHKLVVNGTGKLSETVEEGAYMILQVKYGLIRIINQKADLCENVRNVDLDCPLEKGKEIVLGKEVDLPKEIPPGTYNAIADVYTKDDKKITCLSAQVKFSLGGMALGDGLQQAMNGWKEGL